MSDSIVKNKSYDFAIKIVNLYKFLVETKKEFVLSKQILKSGTSIGANVNEALQGQSKKDFMSKMNIALKECCETKYWLDLICDTEYIDEKTKVLLYNQCIELEKMLTKIVKTTKQKIEKKK